MEAMMKKLLVYFWILLLCLPNYVFAGERLQKTYSAAQLYPSGVKSFVRKYSGKMVSHREDLESFEKQSKGIELDVVQSCYSLADRWDTLLGFVGDLIAIYDNIENQEDKTRTAIILNGRPSKILSLTFTYSIETLNVNVYSVNNQAIVTLGNQMKKDLRALRDELNSMGGPLRID